MLNKRSVIFTVLTVLCTACLQVMQFFTLFLLFSRKLYRRVNSVGIGYFGSLLAVLTSLVAPIEIVVSGDYKQMSRDEHAIVIANHQIYTDWWYLWLLSWYFNKHGYIKIILKESLKWLPIFGPGMMFFEFIFLKRRWMLDRDVLKSAFKRCVDDNLPVWLLLFPEGTVITADTKQTAQERADRANWTEQLQHVIHPKITGTFFACQKLRMFANTLYDVTIAYSGLAKDDCPYDEYPLSKVFFLGQGPKRVYMHINAFKLSAIPGLDSESPTPLSSTPPPSRSGVKSNEEQFGYWLRQRFVKKDNLIAKYHKEGAFSSECLVIKVKPRVKDYIVLFAGVYLGFALLFMLLRIINKMM